MSARDDLRALAARLDGDTYLHDAPKQAADLRALAARIDAEMALASDSVERPDGSPGQWLEAGARISLLARLDADLTHPVPPPPPCASCEWCADTGVAWCRNLADELVQRVCPRGCSVPIVSSHDEQLAGNPPVAGAPRNPAKPPCATCGGSGRKVDAMARIGSRPCPTCTPGAKP